MKKSPSLLFAVTAACLIASAAAPARPIAPPPGAGAGRMPMPAAGMYDPATVETIRGEVVAVDRVAPPAGMAGGKGGGRMDSRKGGMRGPLHEGVHLRVRTDKETISVHLGPAWYIDNQDVRIAPKDAVAITGSRSTFEGKPALVAATVTKGDEVLTLRDASGYPVWRGWRARPAAR